MRKNEKKKKLTPRSMELVIGGRIPGPNGPPGEDGGCYCSPGGYETGRTQGEGGCACACKYYNPNDFYSNAPNHEQNFKANRDHPRSN